MTDTELYGLNIPFTDEDLAELGRAEAERDHDGGISPYIRIEKRRRGKVAVEIGLKGEF